MSSEFIYEKASFPSVHASTIAETGDGLIAAFFGGTREGANDVGIWVSRRESKGWTPPVEVATGVQPDGSRLPCWNPVLFQMPGGALTLFYKVGPNPREWWGMVRTSRDGGRTWGDAQRLPDGVLGPIKNKPVRLADGTILSPSSTESPEKPSLWRVHFERSTDGGQILDGRATRSRAGRARAARDPAEHPDSRREPRCRRSAARARSGCSRRGRRTAARRGAPLTLTSLPNSSTGTDAVTLRDGRHLLVYNHTAKGRTPLNVALSRDGKAWSAALVLEHEPGEYSYPAVMQAADGLVHITYTWKRERVRHVVVDPKQLRETPIVASVWPHSR